MSHTDKTKPWAVRVMDHRPWANHDHRDGVCDLPAHYRDNQYAGGGHCRWSDWNICYADNCCYGCGCRSCTGYYARRADRRRSRHLSAAECRQILKLHTGGGDDITPRRPVRQGRSW